MNYIDKTIIVPATAKVVPTQHVVYDCPAGSILYRNVSGLYTTTGSLNIGYATITSNGSSGVVSGDQSYYKDTNPEEPKDDAEHYCISKEHTTSPPKSSTD